MAYQTVTGQFLAADGRPLSGSVCFTPRLRFARDAKAIYLPSPVSVTLTEDGRITASLLVPGDGVEPSSWVWHACPALRHGGASVPFKGFDFELTAEAPVELAQVAPVPDATVGKYITKGDRGEQGPKGEQGEAGPMGPAGPQGEQGPQGPGFAGSVYQVGNSLRFSWGNPRTGESKTLSVSLPAPIPGPAGPKGEQGETGPAGPVGPTGPRGERGEVGPPGPQGLRGERGETGPPGPQGPTGFTGPVGPTGPKGEPGNPAAMVLVGVGRPDVPASLSPENQQAVVAAPIGATFTSTDGGGTGAWAWVKTVDGWQVTYGKTGFSVFHQQGSSGNNFGPLSKGWVTRAGHIVQVVAFIDRESGSVWSMLRPVPFGFRPPRMWLTLETAAARTSSYAPVWAEAAHVIFNINGDKAPVGSGDTVHVVSSGQVRGKNLSRSGWVTFTWATDDPWPATLPGSLT